MPLAGDTSATSLRFPINPLPDGTAERKMTEGSVPSSQRLGERLSIGSGGVAPSERLDRNQHLETGKEAT
jgi:hypothetical protein